MFRPVIAPPNSANSPPGAGSICAGTPVIAANSSARQDGVHRFRRRREGPLLPGPHKIAAQNKALEGAEFFTGDHAALLAATLARTGRVNAEIALRARSWEDRSPPAVSDPPTIMTRRRRSPDGSARMRPAGRMRPAAPGGAGGRDEHAAGWAACLERLDRLAAPAGPRRAGPAGGGPVRDRLSRDRVATETRM
jgi:hypothetical protein